MNKIIFIFSLLYISLALSNDAYLVLDKIAVVIYTDTDSIIITKKEIEKETIDGKKRTIQEIIIDNLIYYDAINYYKMPVPQEMIDRHISMIKEQNRLSDEQLHLLFKNAGYSYQEGLDQLKMMYVNSSLIDYLIKSKVIISEQEIKDFYAKHPIIKEANYFIKRAIIENPSLTEEDIFKELEKEKSDLINFNDPYLIEESELASSSEFIKSMKVNEHIIQKDGNGYEIICLIDKNEKQQESFESKKEEISSHLKNEKMTKIFDEYKSDLLKKYEISYL